MNLSCSAGLRVDVELVLGLVALFQSETSLPGIEKIADIPIDHPTGTETTQAGRSGARWPMDHFSS